MKSDATKRTVLEALFPRVRANILRVLFMAPKKRKHLRHLARLSHASASTTHEELAVLTAAGIVSTGSNGSHRFYWPNQDHPLFPALLHLVHNGERSVNLSNTRRIRRGSVKRKKRTADPRYFSGKTYPLRWGIFSPQSK
jgi:hypothetical protein